MSVIAAGAVTTAWVVAGIVALGWLARRLLGASISVMRTILVGVSAYFVGAPVVLLVTAGALQVESGDAINWQFAPAQVLVVVVSAIWVLAVSAGILVALEATWPSADGRGLVASISELSMRRRRATRYLQVLRIATRHGLRPFLNGRARPSQARYVETAIVDALNDAGVAFVKLGQLLATRPDLVPPGLATALSALHSTAAPVPWHEIERVVEEELGGPVSRHFGWIDPEPLAAASIGQVHAARLLDGREVVVKVQRPLARAQLEVDIDIANRLARRIESRSPAVRRMRLSALVEGLTDALRSELSYATERENMLLLAAARRRRAPTVGMPAVVPELSTDRLLVVERVAGSVLSHADARFAGLAPEQRRRMALELVDEMVQQILVDGIFHADLHPGNLMVEPSGTLTLIDFGSVAILDQEQRLLLATLLLALHAEDPSSAIVAIRHLVDDARHVDEGVLRRDLGALFTVAQFRMDVDAVVSALLAILWKHQLAIPAPVAAAARSVASLLHLVSLLDPSLDAIAEVTSRARSRVKRLATGDRAAEAAWAQAATLGVVARQVPARLDLVAQSIAMFALDRSINEHRRPAVRRRMVRESVAVVFTTACAVAALVLVSLGGAAEPSGATALLPIVGAALGAIAVLGGLRTWVTVRQPR